MTHKYETQCWFCDSRDMENKGDFVQCLACGATWSEPPKLNDDPLAPYEPYFHNHKGRVMGKMRRPSKSVSRAAAKARSQNS